MELSWETFRGNVLEFLGYRGTLSVSQMQTGARLTGKSSTHRTPIPCLNWTIFERIETNIMFWSHLCAVSLIIDKNGAKTI